MKTLSRFLSVMFILFLQFSCGGTKDEKPVQDSPSASDLMTEAPAYDASKIDPNAEVETINLKAIGNTMADISYDNTMIKVKGGTTVNKDYIPAMKEVLVATKMLKPKESTEIIFPAPSAGTYNFICTYPGHSMRMRGKFVVEGGI